MKAARLFVSEAAAADILEQADWYEVQSGKPLAARWEKAVTAAILRIVKGLNLERLAVSSHLNCATFGE